MTIAPPVVEPVAPVVPAPPVTPPAPEPPGPSPFDALPADLKNDPSLKGIKNLEILARNYVETKKMVGRSVQLKDGEAPGEDVYVKLGRPADPTGYKFSKPDFGGKPIELGDAFEEHVRNVAFSLQLNQKQFDEYVNRQSTMAETGHASFVKRTEEWDKQLETEWGSNTDRNTAIAARAVAYYDSDGSFRKVLNATGFGDHPALAKLFYDAGKRLQEDGLVMGEVGGLTSRDGANSRIQEIRADPEHLKNTEKGNLLQGELAKLYQLRDGA
jgi:hypothetical protein